MKTESLKFFVVHAWAKQAATDAVGKYVRPGTMSYGEMEVYKLGVERGFLDAIATLQLHSYLKPMDYVARDEGGVA